MVSESQTLEGVSHAGLEVIGQILSRQEFKWSTLCKCIIKNEVVIIGY